MNDQGPNGTPFTKGSSGSAQATDADPSQPSLVRKSTGPRTVRGKQRSKYNATKYAIFSRVALLESEPRSELNSILEGLKEYFYPRGAPEGILVDKLATLFWRYRRLLIAEAAEIRKRVAFPDFDKENESSKFIRVLIEEEDAEDTGLMSRIADPEVLEKCLGLLRDLKAGIKRSGFDGSRDSAILTKLYGKCDTENEKGTLFERYPISLSPANCSGEERQQNGSSPEQCANSFLRELEEEIERLERYESIESKRMESETLRQYVPDSSQPDRLLRYESSLERNIDRTLSQLERLQRMRAGQPVPPELKVRVSG